MRTAPKPLPSLSDSDKARFLSRIDKNGPLPDQSDIHYAGLDQCWSWIGNATKQGYGRFGIKKSIFFAHRISSVIHNGQIDNLNPIVLHRCDNPNCVNPAHLIQGTFTENAKDRDSKGRANTQMGINHYSKTKPLVGSRNNKARLNEKKVLEMRNLRENGESVTSLALKFGVSLSVTSNVCSGKAWKHVPQSLTASPVDPAATRAR